jgi:hypothetical protein
MSGRWQENSSFPRTGCTACGPHNTWWLLRGRACQQNTSPPPTRRQAGGTTLRPTVQHSKGACKQMWQCCATSPTTSAAAKHASMLLCCFCCGCSRLPRTCYQAVGHAATVAPDGAGRQVLRRQPIDKDLAVLPCWVRGGGPCWHQGRREVGGARAAAGRIHPILRVAARCPEGAAGSCLASSWRAGLGGVPYSATSPAVVPLVQP